MQRTDTRNGKRTDWDYRNSWLRNSWEILDWVTDESELISRIHCPEVDFLVSESFLIMAVVSLQHFLFGILLFLTAAAGAPTKRHGEGLPSGESNTKRNRKRVEIGHAHLTQNSSTNGLKCNFPCSPIFQRSRIEESQGLLWAIRLATDECEEWNGLFRRDWHPDWMQGLYYHIYGSRTWISKWHIR